MHHIVPCPHRATYSSNPQSGSSCFDRQLLIVHLPSWVERNISKIETKPRGANARMGEGSVNGSATNFHGGDRVQDLDGTLERFEIRVLVREHAESALVDAKTNTRVNVLLRGLEPSIAGSLCDRG